MSGGVLVAGIGNVFLSDDAFGVEVVNRLATTALPPSVRVADFGIRGVHLAFELLDGYDALIIVDAVPMLGEPGTVAVIEHDIHASAAGPEEPVALDAHSMSPEIVLGTLARLGGKIEPVFVVGCQPASLEEGIGLTPSVARAVDVAVALCHELLDELLEPPGKGAAHVHSHRGITGARAHRGARHHGDPRHRPVPKDEGDVR